MTTRRPRPTRRQLLLGGAAATASAAAFGGLGPLRHLAQAGAGTGQLADRYFILCYFSGGWDVLLGLDPRDPSVFTEEVVSATRIQPAYDLLDDEGHITQPFWSEEGVYLGPYIGRLAQHSDKLAIVRGMSMETLTHEAGRRRFITGKPPSGLLARGSAGATWLAAAAGSQDPIPNLALRVESYNVDQPPWATAMSVDGVDDLLRALEPTGGLSALEARHVDQLLIDAAACPRAQRSPAWQTGEGSRRAAQQVVEGGLAGEFDFLANDPHMEAIADRYGIGSLDSAAARAATAVRAITRGISRVVSFTITGGLDTHYENWALEQGPNQERGFDLVATMVEDLASTEYGGTGESWLDRTTIVGFSEFGRTAMLNANEGRDHSLSSACFLLGAGIRGGQAIGASSDVGLGPAPTDLRTGLPDPGGEVVKPEHVLRTLMTGMGIADDVADLRVGPIEALQT